MDSESPTISVVLPMHNAEKTISRAVASVRAQSFVDWELVIVDDGSEDGSAAVVEEFFGFGQAAATLKIGAKFGGGVCAQRSH